MKPNIKDILKGRVVKDPNKEGRAFLLLILWCMYNCNIIEMCDWSKAKNIWLKLEKKSWLLSVLSIDLNWKLFFLFFFLLQINQTGYTAQKWR